MNESMMIRIFGSLIGGIAVYILVARAVGKKRTNKDTRANWVKLDNRKATDYERWADGDGMPYGTGAETTTRGEALHLGEQHPPVANGYIQEHEARVDAQVDAALNVRMDAPVETATNYEATAYTYTKIDNDVVYGEWREV